MFHPHGLKFHRRGVFAADRGELLQHAFRVRVAAEMFDYRAGGLYRVLGDVGHLPGVVCLGIPRNGDVGHVLQSHARVLQGAANGVFGEARTMFLAFSQPLFGYGKFQFAIDDHACRRIGVKGVDSKYDHHVNPSLCRC